MKRRVQQSASPASPDALGINDQNEVGFVISSAHAGGADHGSSVLAYSPDALPRISEIIARGGVIAFRTDTFYGLGADPFNRTAVQRITELKGREDGKPILIVISDREQVARFIPTTSASFNHLAERFWPGPLTLIGEAAGSVPPEITAGSNTIGVRFPDDEHVQTLVGVCGGALTATSANPAGRAPGANATMVAEYFFDQLDLIVDDGAAKTDKPSTVVDASRGELELVREGVIRWTEILDAVPGA